MINLKVAGKTGREKSTVLEYKTRFKGLYKKNEGAMPLRF